MPARKEQRTSLGELFQKARQVEDNSAAKSEKAEKRTEKDTDKSAVHLMKKMLKKRIIHAPSKNSTTTGGGTMDSASAETKLQKVRICTQSKYEFQCQTMIKIVKLVLVIESKYKSADPAYFQSESPS